jgi:hypothetical protein
MKKVIQLKNIETVKCKYLKEIGLSIDVEPDLQQGNKLFYLVTKDFKTGVLTLDEFSGLGFYLFHAVAKRYPSSLLFQATLSASELGFAVRSPAVYMNISKYLEAIDTYLGTSKSST